MQKLNLTLERIAEMHAILADHSDDQLTLDTLEGETDAFEWVDYFIGQVAEEQATQQAIRARVTNLNARKVASEVREDGYRKVLGVLVEAIGQKSLRRPEATVSLKAKPSGIAGIDESLLPDRFFRTKREVDKSAVNEAVKNGEIVPGITASNGGVSLAIRFT